MILRNAEEAVLMTKELALQSVGRPLEDGMRLYREMYRRLAASNEQQRRLETFGAAKDRRRTAKEKS